MDGINRNYRVYSVLQVILTVAIFGTVCFIFSNSMQTGLDSSSASQAVQDFLQGLLRRLGHPAAAARLTEHMVRKAAHFCEYMLEGFLLLLGVRLFSRKLRFLSWPALLGLLTALCDETIQLFYAGRGSSVTDVWIDFAGVVTGMAAPCCCRPCWGPCSAPAAARNPAGGTSPLRPCGPRLRCPVFAAPVAAGLQKADRCPCSASAVSSAGRASASQSRKRGRQ